MTEDDLRLREALIIGMDKEIDKLTSVDVKPNML